MDGLNCLDCKYGYIERVAEDDYNHVCDPPDGICPHDDFYKAVALYDIDISDKEVREFIERQTAMVTF